MTSDPPPGVSIFIPVFNEADILEKNINTLLSSLNRFGFPYEVIIGSNGSRDDTPEIAKHLSEKNPDIKWFHIPARGVGKAFRKGVTSASYPRIISVDMDLSIDLEFIEKAYHLLSHHDIVVGSKINGTQKRSLIRKTASNCFISLAAALLDIRFSDYSIAAKGYRKELVTTYMNYIDDHTFYVVEMIHRSQSENKRLTEIPVKCHDMRISRFNLVHEGIYKFGNLFLLWIKSIRSRG